MTPERWKQIDKVLQSALEREPSHRTAFLDEACGQDESLRKEVESLIASHQLAGSFIEKPAFESTTQVLAENQAQETEKGVETESLVGACLDRYQILRLLGAGGMGQVYLAEDTKLNRQVALKILPDHLKANGDLLARFKQEALNASKLNHQNIVTVYDIGQVKTVHFIATEFIDGETLEDRSSKAKLPLGEALDIAIQIASALATAHQAGIIHRDIKPKNVMLRPDGHVKVIDFGLAKLIERQPDESNRTPRMARIDTEPGIVMGTLHYMSPEQATGVRPDARTDIFSFGVVLYEMIAGTLPFNGTTQRDVIAAILTKRQEPLAHRIPDVPAKLEQIVFKTLQKDREHRYREMKDLLADLREVKQVLETRANSRENLAKAFQTNLNVVSAPSNSFIGREAEMATLTELLEKEAVRLVTLTGTGGVGKTRLSLQLAASLIDRFSDGVRFISLESINQASDVVHTIAHALSIKEAGSTPLLEIVKEHLREMQMMLVLDNFEQIISAAPLLAELLGACQLIKIAVTSREALHLQGEHEFEVPPLRFPDRGPTPRIEALSQYPAVVLFSQRAFAVNSHFALTDENAAVVTEICKRLDGIPLAIELAAARIKVLPPKVVLARLKDRFKLLTRGAHDLPSRQQTMRNTIAWSYDLLDEQEKRLFRQLSVFVGGFSLEAAEAVCGETGDLSVLDGISSLIDKSLLRHRQDGDEPRFAMFETIREFGLEDLTTKGEAEGMRRGHALFFLGLVEQAERGLKRSEQMAWLERLDVERENLRAALHWSRESGEVEIGLRIAAAPWRFWEVNGPITEGSMWLKELLAGTSTGEVSEEVRAKALYAAGVLGHIQNDFKTARVLLEESLALFEELEDKQGIACSLNTLGLLAHDQGDDIRALKLLDEGLELSRDLDDKDGIAYALGNLGLIAQDRGDYDRAISLQEESLSIRSELGDRLGAAASLNNVGLLALDRGYYKKAEGIFEQGLVLFREMAHKLGTAISLNNLGELALFQGDSKRAEPLFTESLRIFREESDRRNVAALLTNLGNVARFEGDYERARSLYADGLTMIKGGGDRSNVALCLEGLASLARVRGHMQSAAQLFGGADAVREDARVPRPPVRSGEYSRNVADLRAALGDEAFCFAWLKGHSMTLEQITAFANDCVVNIYDEESGGCLT